MPALLCVVMDEPCQPPAPVPGRDRAAFPTQEPFVMEHGGMSLSPHFCQIWLKSARILKSYYSRHVARYRQAWTAQSQKLHFIRKLS